MRSPDSGPGSGLQEVRLAYQRNLLVGENNRILVSGISFSKQSNLHLHSGHARWLADPALREQIADTRARLLDEATFVLAGHVAQAARVLGELLRSEDERTRLHAARIPLSQSLARAKPATQKDLQTCAHGAQKLLSKTLDPAEITEIQTRIVKHWSNGPMKWWKDLGIVGGE